MIFCEDCRIKKNWPRATGFPYVGISQSTKCEICNRIGTNHDVPASMLTPESKKTFEEKMVGKAMQEGYKDKAENLVVVHVSGSEAGKLNHEKTASLRSILVKSNGVVDWYWTYKMRVMAQEGYQKDEEDKRNRRTYT